MTKKLFADLDNAIRNVIESATDTRYADTIEVDAEKLWQLQEEYNIHFREPTAKQLKILNKPIDSRH